MPDIALGYLPTLRRLGGLIFIGLKCQAIETAPANSYPLVEKGALRLTAEGLIAYVSPKKNFSNLTKRIVEKVAGKIVVRYLPAIDNQDAT